MTKIWNDILRLHRNFRLERETKSASITYTCEHIKNLRRLDHELYQDEKREFYIERLLYDIMI